MGKLLSLTDRLKRALGETESESEANRVYALLCRTGQKVLSVNPEEFYSSLKHDSLSQENIVGSPSEDEVRIGRELAQSLYSSISPLHPEQGIRGYGPKYGRAKLREYIFLKEFYLSRRGNDQQILPS